MTGRRISPETGVECFSGGGDTVRRGLPGLGSSGEVGEGRSVGGDTGDKGWSASKGDTTTGGTGAKSSAGERTSSDAAIGAAAMVALAAVLVLIADGLLTSSSSSGRLWSNDADLGVSCRAISSSDLRRIGGSLDNPSAQSIKSMFARRTQGSYQ